MGQTELLNILRELPKGTYMDVDTLKRLSGMRRGAVLLCMNKLERFDFVDKIKVSRVGDTTVFNLYYIEPEDEER